MIYRLGELFCGPGGLAWGATHADIGNPDWGIRHQWANDFDESTCDTYRHNICHNDEDASVICQDVRKLDISRNTLADIDALAFGFPCNDFSTVGEQKGFDGTYGPLYTYGVKVLQEFQKNFAQDVPAADPVVDAEAEYIKKISGAAQKKASTASNTTDEDAMA